MPSRNVSRHLKSPKSLCDLTEVDTESESVNTHQTQKEKFSDTIVALFDSERSLPLLASGQLVELHANIRELLDSKLGPFAYDFFKVREKNLCCLQVI